MITAPALSTSHQLGYAEYSLTAFLRNSECRDTAFNISTKWGFAARWHLKVSPVMKQFETIRDLDRVMNTENYFFSFPAKS